ncbi:hypothetical protein C8R43DRAFT_192953 [Mycena crocata]|nr:hypothetical protein C8R43DRAFT_192953 [Mycena crocata]
MASTSASQFNQILWILIAIRGLFHWFDQHVNPSQSSVVLYILFGILFIVMSHLQERLQRRPEVECPMRQFYQSQPWDHASLSCSKDLEGQIPGAHNVYTGAYPPITVCVHYEDFDGHDRQVGGHPINLT